MNMAESCGAYSEHFSVEALLSRFGQSAFRSAHAFQIGAFGPRFRIIPCVDSWPWRSYRWHRTSSVAVRAATCPTRMAEGLLLMVWSYLLPLESGKQRVAGAAAVFAVHRKLPDI